MINSERSEQIVRNILFVEALFLWFYNNDEMIKSK